MKLPRGLSHIVLSSPQLMRPAKKKGERPERVRVQPLVVRTDSGLHARLTPFGVTIWVTTLRQGSAVAGAEVALYDDKGAPLWRDKTDGAGVAQASRQPLGRLLRKKKPPKLYLLASHAGDAAYLIPSNRSWRTNRMWTRPGTGEDVRKARGAARAGAPLGRGTLARLFRPPLVGYVSTERGIYRPGHVVHIHGAVRRFRSWRAEPAAGLGVEVELLGENGELLGRKKIQSQRSGRLQAAPALARGWAPRLPLGSVAAGRARHRQAHPAGGRVPSATLRPAPRGRQARDSPEVGPSSSSWRRAICSAVCSMARPIA